MVYKYFVADCLSCARTVQDIENTEEASILMEIVFSWVEAEAKQYNK